MVYFKNIIPRLEKMLRSAKGQPCIRCGKNDGTTCARHYCGIRQHDYGKGRGIKCNHLITAEFCEMCDALFSEGSEHLWREASIEFFNANPQVLKVIRSEAFLHYVSLTNIRRLERGDL